MFTSLCRSSSFEANCSRGSNFILRRIILLVDKWQVLVGSYWYYIIEQLMWKWLSNTVVGLLQEMKHWCLCWSRLLPSPLETSEISFTVPWNWNFCMKNATRTLAPTLDSLTLAKTPQERKSFPWKQRFVLIRRSRPTPSICIKACWHTWCPAKKDLSQQLEEAIPQSLDAPLATATGTGAGWIWFRIIILFIRCIIDRSCILQRPKPQPTTTIRFRRLDKFKEWKWLDERFLTQVQD